MSGPRDHALPEILHTFCGPMRAVRGERPLHEEAVVSETQLCGAYRLIAQLGSGAMADVFLGIQDGPKGTGAAKLAVVKKLRGHLAEDPDFVAMLMDEARICARLSHPNVVHVFEAVEDEAGCFLAMEHLDGQPLHKIEPRARKAGETVPRTLHYAILADVLAGLHHAHELRDYDGEALDIVHRDVTPHNIFVTHDGAVKLMDFGVAKAARRVIETRHGLMKGKVRYMSPEQARSEPVDRRTDIFAAGVILWNAATGARFWADAEDVTVLAALARGDYEASPRAFDPAVPEEIDRICRRALAFRKEDRYATADEMRADLERAMEMPAALLHGDLACLMQRLFARERKKLNSLLKSAANAPKLSRAALKLPAVGSTSRRANAAMRPAKAKAKRSRKHAPRAVPARSAKARWPMAVGAAVLAIAGVFAAAVHVGAFAAPRAPDVEPRVVDAAAGSSSIEVRQP